jgi:large subunit ribosomal protein L13
MKIMKTYSAKPTEVERKWYVLDASETTMGRISTRAATLLTGKEKPMFTHHIDCGDYVIIINADQLKVTGDKMRSKMYYHHSHFPGGLKEASMESKMAAGKSTEVLEHAIRGMLPVNRLRDGRLTRLKIYGGSEHQHEAQKPKTISVKEGR